MKCAEDNHNNVHHTQELVFHLVGTAEDMSVVLRKTTHTRQAMEFSALLITVYRSEFCQTQGQVFVRTWLPRIDGAVMRAIHRFEHVLLTLFGRVDRLE
ncbi:uncharacterized protein BN773_00857 [Prevotella sp. CAG:755]|nr:uncharacterized protein BN773_00857 [Prevotella sp. CAG:755]